MSLFSNDLAQQTTQQLTSDDAKRRIPTIINSTWSHYIPTFDFFTAIERMKLGKEVRWAEHDTSDRYFMQNGEIYKRCVGGILQKGPSMMTGVEYCEYVAPVEGPRF